MTDPVIKALSDQGYSYVRKLPDGKYVGLMRMLTTIGLLVMDEEQWFTRYCYKPEDVSHALIAAHYWDGEGDPPGNWLVQKPGDRRNQNRKAA